MKRVAITAFGVTTGTFCASFADGLMCTRSGWLLVGPIELLYLPAFALLVIAAAWAVVRYIRSRMRHLPASSSGVGWQLATAALLGLLYFTNLDPRLSGLAARAELQQKALLDFASRYRAGGDSEIKNHAVLAWNTRFRPVVSATSDYVEVSWGSALPRSWGFRVADGDRPMPQFQPVKDEAAMRATERITVFIGVF